jgi:hypothetical protein
LQYEKLSEKTNENVATNKSTAKNEAELEEEAPSGVLVGNFRLPQKASDVFFKMVLTIRSTLPTSNVLR